MLASCLMIIGYAVIAVPTGIVSAEISRQETGKRQSPERQCLECGEEGHDWDALFCKHCGKEVPRPS